MGEYGEYSELIKELRIKMEESAERLKKLEMIDDEGSANSALWIAYGIWNGREYGNIESKLREKGHKSSIDMLKLKK